MERAHYTFDACMSAHVLDIADNAERARAINEVLSHIPQTNLNTLVYLIRHLAKYVPRFPSS